MKYAISILKTESDAPEYKKERYNTLEEAQKAYDAIPEDERGDFGIAEIHSPEEIAAMEAAPDEEV